MFRKCSRTDFIKINYFIFSLPANLSRQAEDFPLSVQSRLLQAECPLTGLPQCTPASKRYRTADGSCNNEEKPWKGSSMKPMQRFILPIYDDGIKKIKRSQIRQISLLFVYIYFSGGFCEVQYS